MKKKSSRKPARAKSHLRLWVLAIALVASIAAVEWIAPPFILKTVNQNLNKRPGYRNHVGDLDINLLRGGYTLKDFEIKRVLGDTVLPIFTAKSIDVSLRWSGLFQGKVTGEISLRDPSLHIVRQFLNPKKRKKPLLQTLERFYPFPMDRLQVRDGSIHFEDFTDKGTVDVYIDALNGDARGLAAFRTEGTKAADSAKRRASAWITAKAMGKTPIRVEMDMLPGTRYPDLDMQARFDDMPLTLINNLFRAYADIDVESGTVGFSSRIRAQGGRFRGRLEPRMRDLKILDKKSDGGIAQRAWEGLADAAGKFLEKENRVRPGGGRPLSGSFTRTGQDEWKALGSLLTGAFAHSLDPRLGKFIPPQEGIVWDIVE